MSEREEHLAETTLHILLKVLKHFRCLFRQEHHPQLAPGHFRILMYLIHRQPNLQELADRAMVTPATMSKTVHTLQEHGWVTRTQNPSDRRQVIIALTEKGKTLLEGIHQEVIAEICKKLANFSNGEMDALEKGMQLLPRVFFETDNEEDKDRSMV
jgi:DNA-binding MarR family transcriptional regulator